MQGPDEHLRPDIGNTDKTGHTSTKVYYVLTNAHYTANAKVFDASLGDHRAFLLHFSSELVKRNTDRKIEYKTSRDFSDSYLVNLARAYEIHNI